jgi:hypothetical protein
MTDALFPRAGTCRRAIPRLILPRPGLMARDDWQAHLHPRDETGKFTSGPGSHAESTPKHPAWMGKTGQAFYDEVVNGLGSKHHDEIAQALKDKAATLKAGDYSSYANKLLAHVEQAHGLEKGKLGKAKPMGKAAPPAAKEPPAPAPEPAKAPDVDAEFKSMVDEALATGSPQQHAEFLEGLIPHTEGAKKAYLEGQLADLKGKIAAGTAKGEATEAPLSAEKAARKAEIEAAEEPAAPPPEIAALPDPATKVQKNIHDLMQSDLPVESIKQKIANIAEASQHPPNKAYAEQALALLEQQAGTAAPSMQDEAYAEASKALTEKGNIGFWLDLANSNGVDPDAAVGIKQAIAEWQDANPPDDDEPAFFAPAEPEAPEPAAPMTTEQVDSLYPDVSVDLKSAWNEEIAKNKKGAIKDLENVIKHFSDKTPEAEVSWMKDKVAALKGEGTAPAPPADTDLPKPANPAQEIMASALTKTGVFADASPETTEAAFQQWLASPHMAPEDKEYAKKVIAKMGAETGAAPAAPAPMTSEQVDAAHPDVTETLKKNWNQSIAQDPAGSAATLQKYLEVGAGLSPTLKAWMKDKVAALNAAGHGTAAPAEPPAPPPEPPVSLPAPHPSSKGQTLVHGIASGEGSKADKIAKIKQAVADDPHHFPAGGYAKKYADQLIAALGGDQTAQQAAPKPAAAAAPAAPAAKPAAADPALHTAPAGSATHEDDHAAPIPAYFVNQGMKAKSRVSAHDTLKRIQNIKAVAANAKTVTSITTAAAKKLCPTATSAWWKTNADASVISAIQSYSGSGYGTMNAVLRGDSNDPAALAKINHIDDMFEHDEAAVTDDVIVHRGENLTDDTVIAKWEAALKAGKPVREIKHGFTSASLADHAAFSHHNVQYQITVRKGSRMLGIGVKGVSGYGSDENEVLLRHGQTFEIYDITRASNGRVFVKMAVTT